MRVDSQKNIVCDSEGSIATINHLAAENIFGEKVTPEDVISVLAAHGIVSNIDTMAIEIAVEISNKTGEPIENLVVAKSRVKNEYVFANSICKETSDLIRSIDSARKAYNAYHQISEEESSGFQTRFVKENSLVCQILFADQENIYGEKVKKQNLPIVLKPGNNISFSETMNSVSFHAEKDGYLVIDENMRIHVISPFQYTSDRMKLLFIIMPLASNEEYKELLNYYAKEHQTLVLPDLATVDLYSVMERVKLVEAEQDIVEHLVIAQGVSPIPGQNASIELLADTEREKHEGEISIAEYMKMGHYTMVSDGELLAKLTPAIEGVPGTDVYGNKILSPETSGKEVEIGDNIRTEEIDDVVHLYAAKDGCLLYNNYRISVSDALHIKGDVGPDTGNISQGSSVIVNGNIMSGFSVECKNDLIVKGSIENGAMVKCGNLIVRKGVFCKKGLTFVKNNADICYIQDANLRVSGDLTVQRYIHGSRISVRGDLTVLGRGVTGKERGAVMGSRISVLGNATLHSVGNSNDETIIACGVDQEMHSQIENSETMISNLQSEVASKQNSIAIDLNSTNAVELLSNMPKYKKDQIAETLKEIKRLLNTIDIYNDKIEALKEKAYAEDLSIITISINNFIIPKTTLAIGSNYTSITQKLYSSKARLDSKGNIRMYPNY